MGKKLITTIAVFLALTVTTVNFTSNADIKEKIANDNSNSFKLELSAVSLNTQEKDDDYHVIDGMTPSKYLEESYSRRYFPEVINYIEAELKKQNYKKAKWDEEEWAKDWDKQIPPKIKIKIYYSELPPNNPPATFLKLVTIKASLWSSDIPLWEVRACHPKYADEDFRILIPSIIKCAAPYFNKNFKGTITCKR